MRIIKKTSEFELAVSTSQIPVLVYFSAPWCAHCKSLNRVIDEIDQTQKDKINVVSVDVDALPDVTAELNIRSIPTLLLFDDGVLTNSTTGTKTKENIMEMLANVPSR